MNCQQNSLTVPEYCNHHFCSTVFVWISWACWGMRVHPLFRLLFGLCIHKLYPSLITNHNSVKKFVPLFPVALKKRQDWSHSLILMKVSQLFWYPLCTELMVTQSVRDSSIQSSPRSLWKFFRKLWYHERTFSVHALVDFLNEFISHNWVSSLTTFVMHISVPIPEFSAPFSHTTALITLSLYTRHNRQWISAALCPSAWRKWITARTSQLAGAAMIVSMFHQ